jgi:hypothetical protein
MSRHLVRARRQAAQRRNAPLLVGGNDKLERVAGERRHEATLCQPVQGQRWGSSRSAHGARCNLVTKLNLEKRRFRA